MNIICFPHAGGQASSFYFMKKEGNFNVIPYEYSAHGSKISENAYETFNCAVQSIAEDIVRMDIDDILLFGHSMGAYIAYEVAYVLENQYQKKISAVVVSGQVAPSKHIKSNIQHINDSEFLNYLVDMGGIQDEVKKNKELLEVLLPIIRLDYMLLDSYQPDKTHIIKSPLYIFVGNEDREVIETNLEEWKFFAKIFKGLIVFSGDHFYLHDNQRKLIETLSNIIEELKKMEEVKYSWAPTVKWRILDENRLKIANFIFKGEYTKLFPRFYDVTKQGMSVDELEQEFEKFNKQKLNKFVKKLIDTEILVEGIQQIDALFYSQNNLFSANHPFDEEIRINATKLNEFKTKQLLREKNLDNSKRIKLLVNEEIYDKWKDRKTVRVFDNTKQISFNDFSNLLSCLMQRKDEQGIKYYYPSAGGLYPIDIYLYIKSERVENVDGGLYYYSPQENEIRKISDEKIEKNTYFYQNQEIFEGSAFSIFFVYNAHASMPKYGGMAYFYGIIETGVISELLSIVSEQIGLGSCIIGEMDYRTIVSLLKINDNEIYIMCMEFGYEK